MKRGLIFLAFLFILPIAFAENLGLMLNLDSSEASLSVLTAEAHLNENIFFDVYSDGMLIQNQSCVFNYYFEEEANFTEYGFYWEHAIF